ncbi:MAG: DUF1109 domain-containing protein [Gemmobacter sp.]|nr:DUF1109 domain-containing protein [Gemmobacter sp.]
MKTDDLIAALAADTPREAPVAVGLVVWVLPALGLVALVLFVTLGLRADLAAALVQPLVLVKTLVPLLVGLVSAGLALRLTRPAAGLGRWPVKLGLVLVPLLVAVAAALALTAPDTWRMQANGKTIWVCLLTIPLMSLLPLVAGMWQMRRGAATRPALAGAALGLAVAGFATALYSLHCTEDSPLFYALWYSCAMLIVALAGLLIGSRTLRW